MPDPSTSTELPAGHRVGRYSIIRKLGRGGMGVVYLAQDERLGRNVALKMIAGLTDDSAIKRFWREARAAASVTHPNICQVYELDETPDGIYLSMELLEGESLDVRLGRGALAPPDAVKTACDVLAALGALHDRGFVHRDVKPSNVFLTSHGAKVLDFGLARPAVGDTLRLDSSPPSEITQAGVILGTPRYMAPEQVTGASADARTDLYSLGAVLFEMLAGRPPFIGDQVFDVLYATLHEHPPALQGPPAVVAIDRVIRRALEKSPASRYEHAGEMAAELRSITIGDATATSIVPVRALTRLVVPPLRLTREDPEAAFLSFGLADAMSSSLAGLGDVVVRAPMVAAKWADEGADLRKLAAAADVDLVLQGSLLRSGDQLRATVQLIEAANGTVVGATTVKGSMGDIFALEDELTKSAVELLAPRRAPAPAKSPSHAPRKDVPENAKAFEHFLRGVELARHPDQVEAARDFFVRAVEEDPGFAPAWAHLGRCHRFIGKFIRDREVNVRRADDAFRRALALNPDLPVAHRYLTHLESEEGHAESAIGRLLRHARTNRNDAQLFAGLVHALRYGGLVKESLAAHEEARRLDPTVLTSVEYTIVLTGDADLVANTPLPSSAASEAESRIMLTAIRGQVTDELRERLQATDLDRVPPGYRLSFLAAYRTLFSPRDAALQAIDTAVTAHTDPEAHFMFTLLYARIAETGKAMALLARIVEGGYTPVSILESDPVLDPLRALPEFAGTLGEAQRRNRGARLIFERGGGRELLGT